MTELNLRYIWDTLIRDRTCTVRLAANSLPDLKKKLSNLKYRTAKTYPELGLSSEKLYYTHQTTVDSSGYLDITITLKDPLSLNS